MVDRALDRSVEEIEGALNKASNELQEAIKLLSIEADRQRILLVKDIKKLMALSFLGLLTLVGLVGIYNYSMTL